jgi:hypothetical protein
MSHTSDKTFRDGFLFDPYKKIAVRGEYLWWRFRGSPGPKVPHLVKQRTIAQFAHEFNLRVLVETGTNLGNMINAQKSSFRQIHSVELNEWLASRAKHKFRNEPNVHLYQGDSGKVLPKILEQINEPCLFWLDAHWGDESAAIKHELEAVYAHHIRDHVLLIDDARWFDGRTDYLTIEELREHAARDYPGSVVEVKDDIIRIYKLKR